jgi:hypothetical protein
MPPFYARVEPDLDLANGYAHLLTAIASLTAKGRTAEASAVRAVLSETVGQFRLLGTRGAAKADIFIRNELRQSQVRPDASGSLAGAVQSMPLTTRLPGGGVGIASIEALDKGARDPNYPAKSYWRAQEYGTAAHVGRIVPGYFQPGQSRPSAGEFRVHPYFDPVLRTRGTPAMVITRPLRARYYLRDGTAKFVVWHVAETERILAAAISRLRVLRIV